MKTVDVRFKLHGKYIPADHGYHLYSAISGIVPEIHENGEVGIYPVSGMLNGSRLMSITEKSFLTIRISSDDIKQILPLAGKTLSVGGYEVRVGVPNSQNLIASARLYSRLVVIKGFIEPVPFLEAVKKQLEELEIKGKAMLVEQSHIAEANKDKNTGTRSPYLRRTIKIRDKTVVGFAVRVTELTAEESVKLQEKGIGGRRRFGCGMFIPDRR